jgi:hypothetical protein
MSAITIPTPLDGFAIVAQGSLQCGSGAVTVQNGSYGCVSGVGNISGTFVGTNDQTSNLTNASNEIPILLSNIIFHKNSLTSQNISPASSGTVTFYSNINYNTLSSIDLSGNSLTINFDASGSSTAQFFLTSAGGANITATMNLLNGAQSTNIFWINDSSGFTPPFSVNNCPVFYGNVISINTTILFNTVPNIYGHSYVDPSGSALVFFNGTMNVNASPICYVKGTKILCKRGYVSIEDLKVGDHVVTLGKIINNSTVELNDRSSEPIIWTGALKVPSLSQYSLPIRIKAGSLGKKMPTYDLLVSPGHRVIVGNSFLLAKELINGTTIVQEKCNEVNYYHLELSSHSIIIANGISSETYLDTGGTRGVFNS